MLHQLFLGMATIPGQNQAGMVSVGTIDSTRNLQGIGTSFNGLRNHIVFVHGATTNSQDHYTNYCSQALDNQIIHSFYS
jgi:hypothetical protein